MKLLVDCHCFDYDTAEGVNTHIRGLYSALIRQAPEDWTFIFAAVHPERLTWVSEAERAYFQTVAPSSRPDNSGIRCEAGTASSGTVPCAGRNQTSERVRFITLPAHGKLRRLFLDYPALIRKTGADWAHFQYTAPFLPLRNKKGRCRLAVTLHDVLFLDFPSRFPWTYRLSRRVLFGLSARRADALLTVSEYSKDRISAHFSIPKTRIHVTPNAVEDAFHPRLATDNASFRAQQHIGPYLLYVSRLEPRKRQDLLVSAYGRLRLWEKGYALVLIGRPTLPTPALEAALDALPAEGRSHVRLLSQVDFQQLQQWYAAASFFVYPAEAEGFGIPPLEAAASGVPVLCSNRTAMADFSFFAPHHIDCGNAATLDAHLSVLLDENKNGPAIRRAETLASVVRAAYNWDSAAGRFIEAIT